MQWLFLMGFILIKIFIFLPCMQNFNTMQLLIITFHIFDNNSSLTSNIHKSTSPESLALHGVVAGEPKEGHTGHGHNLEAVVAATLGEQQVS